MSFTPFDTRSSEWFGDMTSWMRQQAGNNDQQLERVYRNLRNAREQALTPRQQEFLALYYDRGCTIPQIAALCGVNRSTVSRTLTRARHRLLQALRYTF